MVSWLIDFLIDEFRQVELARGENAGLIGPILNILLLFSSIYPGKVPILQFICNR